ncbi:MAG: hypothetical protein N2036_05550 [Bryobacteraceae bacterium]|nr:hypothetical protein [Bryobacteraceae bacterium]MCX7603524.1 hypothetical protein [Bryobacteraceae bacterium]
MSPPPRLPLERHAALLLAAMTAAQGAPFVYARWSLGMPWQPVALGTALAVLLAAAAWRARFLLSSHADMLLVMAAFGGFGMWLGGRMDHWMDPNAPICPLHDTRGVLALAGSWMAWLMLAFAIPPSILWSRCLQPLRSTPARLALALALDMAGMLGGMTAAHFWLGRLWAVRIPPPELGMHLAMLVGMLAGMLPAMWLRDALLAAWARRAPSALSSSVAP